MSSVSLPPSLPKVMTDPPVHPAEIAAQVPVPEQTETVPEPAEQVPVPEPATAEQVPVPEQTKTMPEPATDKQVPVPEQTETVPEPAEQFPVTVYDVITKVTDNVVKMLNEYDTKMQMLDKIADDLSKLNLSDKTAIASIEAQKLKYHEFVKAVESMYSTLESTTLEFTL